MSNQDFRLRSILPALRYLAEETRHVECAEIHGLLAQAVAIIELKLEDKGGENEQYRSYASAGGRASND